jgi:hypothetical protein
VALLMMPLVIELMLGDTMHTIILAGVKVLLNLIIAEGEMMTMTWVESLLVLLLLFAMTPPKETTRTKEIHDEGRKAGSMASTLRTSLDDASTTCSSNKVGKSGAKQEQAKEDPKGGNERQRRVPTGAWPGVWDYCW